MCQDFHWRLQETQNFLVVFHFLKFKMALKRRRYSDNTMIKQHCGRHLLSVRPCASQNALNNTVIAAKGPKDSTLEQTTLNRRQVLLQANEFSPETV